MKVDYKNIFKWFKERFIHLHREMASKIEYSIEFLMGNEHFELELKVYFSFRQSEFIQTFLIPPEANFIAMSMTV